MYMVKQVQAAAAVDAAGVILATKRSLNCGDDLNEDTSFNYLTLVA